MLLLRGFGTILAEIKEVPSGLRKHRGGSERGLIG
jgi:hypothetical protein